MPFNSLFMNCSNCGVCCTETEMMLSIQDIKRLVKIGFHTEKFVKYDKQGYAKLRNIRGYCIFYDNKNFTCSIYVNRPIGCRVYPVIIDEEKGIILDSICESRSSVTPHEKTTKGKRVLRLLKIIDSEAQKRRKDNAVEKKRNPTSLNNPQNEM
jgi:uncharacterized protein